MLPESRSFVKSLENSQIAHDDAEKHGWRT